MDILGLSGTLTLGYSYPNMHLLENYNSPVSIAFQPGMRLDQIFENLGIVGVNTVLFATVIYGIVNMVTCAAFLVFAATRSHRVQLLVVSLLVVQFLVVSFLIASPIVVSLLVIPLLIQLVY